MILIIPFILIAIVICGIISDVYKTIRERIGK